MKNLSIIWDITKYCPWDCNICCMGGTSEKSCLSNELTREEKLDVLLQIVALNNSDYDVRVDLSGGEVLVDPYHLTVINHLSNILGKDNVGISTSDWRVDEGLASFLASNVHDVELTMDVLPAKEYILRPDGYHKTAAHAVRLLKEAGNSVGIQTVACKCNFNQDDAKEVFDWCCNNAVDNWSILKFFPSGRGANYAEFAMNDSECQAYVKMVQQLTAQSSNTFKSNVDFHYLMPGHEKHTHECRCVKKSIGILPNGDVTSCFWALDGKTAITETKYYLGNVRKNSLLEILQGERACYWTNCKHTCELCA